MKKLKKVNAIKIAVVILLIAVGLLILGPRKTIKVSYDPIVYYGDDYNITVVLNGTWSRSEKSFITTNHFTSPYKLSLVVETNNNAIVYSKLLSIIFQDMSGNLQYLPDLSQNEDRSLPSRANPPTYFSGFSFPNLDIPTQNYSINARIEICSESGCIIQDISGALNYEIGVSYGFRIFDIFMSA
ncbi:hypothetical protein KA005_37665 [bacterium]|nr:hypothetical protein [bacterium]